MVLYRSTNSFHGESSNLRNGVCLAAHTVFLPKKARQADRATGPSLRNRYSMSDSGAQLVTLTGEPAKKCEKS